MGVRVINTNLPVIDIPAESTSVANATRVAEAGAYSTDLPAFAQNQITVQKWTLRHTVTEEFLEDDAAGFEAWYSRSLARSLANTEAYYVAIGTGTNQHEGIMVGGDTSGLIFDSDTNITADEIFELFMLLKDGYQGNSSWLMDRDTWRYLATLRDANNWAFGNADMLTINTSGGVQAGTLYGRPVFLQDDISTRSTGNDVIAVGDPDYYALVDRKGLTVARNPYLQQANGLVDFFVHFRQSGAVLAAEAFQIGSMA
jgi:HK97 family phage major capsid protein